ncbi:MAG: aminomethyl-transferring glycine dehydrogenase subunit GcvPB [Treponema sp.]|nr:aminomethyl-transferring glycine dehydrogenase subunit GcvPB [Treponema sp.]
MKLLFEKSVPGRKSNYLAPCDVPAVTLPETISRKIPLNMPELSEGDVARHYSALEMRTFGVNDGFYPLGSCTMKYNPAINETVTSLPGFADIHPLQGDKHSQGMLEAAYRAERYFTEITGMDAISFQPAAGAQGEFLGMMLIKKYHEDRGDAARHNIIIPDSAHGTNPATVGMCGWNVVNLPSNPDGRIDVAKLREIVGPDTAGIMLTNPNTLGIFETDVLEVTRIIHDAGGLCYYDGANLNPIAGIAKPGEMGFDCVHLNLHKTFSTPHGGGGPGSGPVGCKQFLAKYLPGLCVQKTPGGYTARNTAAPRSVHSFHGNVLVFLRALAYVMTLGSDGVLEMSAHAVLNANYLMKRLRERFEIINKGICMHEFVITMEKEAKQGVSAKDMAKAFLDNGMMAPTMYFPLIVKEALMVEPTETEGKETLDDVADIFIKLYDTLMANPETAHDYPKTTVIGRPNEVEAARNPRVQFLG